jgi:hypothetical protein
MPARGFEPKQFAEMKNKKYLKTKQFALNIAAYTWSIDTVLKFKPSSYS